MPVGRARELAVVDRALAAAAEGSGSVAADVASPPPASGSRCPTTPCPTAPGPSPSRWPLLRGNAGSFGYRNPGQVISRWAGVHAGSHDPGCETAILEILGLTGP